MAKREAIVKKLPIVETLGELMDFIYYYNRNFRLCNGCMF